jgi:hypothetical protein
MASEYTRGEMDVADHKRVYGGVMKAGLTAALLTGLIVFYLSVVFGTQAGWFAALIGTVVIGGVLGFALKQKAVYWTCLVVMAVIAVIAGGLVSLFTGPVV